ncbi:DUF2513 domain-containing protein [Pseudomonas soli]|uniref:DUF2513 domain-containing protein n=1 Tax=Pseudomonas soli TaxID=1306993 RepID=UPI0038086B75
MELLRAIMLRIEEEHTDPKQLLSYENFETELVIDGFTPAEVEYHFHLLVNNGMFEIPRSSGGMYILRGLTTKGHDFVDSVRDETIWKLTKGGIEKAGGVTVDMIVTLAKGFIRKQLEKHTGIQIP